MQHKPNPQEQEPEKTEFDQAYDEYQKEIANLADIFEDKPRIDNSSLGSEINLPTEMSEPPLLNESSTQPGASELSNLLTENIAPAPALEFKGRLLYLTKDERFYAFDVDLFQERSLTPILARFNAVVWHSLGISTAFIADHPSIRILLPIALAKKLIDSKLAEASYNFPSQISNESNLPPKILFSFFDVIQITATFSLAERGVYYVLESCEECKSRMDLAYRLNSVVKGLINTTQLYFENANGVLLLHASLIENYGPILIYNKILFTNQNEFTKVRLGIIQEENAKEFTTEDKEEVKDLIARWKEQKVNSLSTYFSTKRDRTSSDEDSEQTKEQKQQRKK